MTQKEFIQKVKNPCINATNIIGGYLPSVLIGQMCLQTGYGTGYNCELLMQWNNLLGMKTQLLNDTWKSEYWNGKSATKTTPEYYGYHTTITDSFRVYDNIQQCACDYLQFMRDAKYSKNGNYKYRDVLTIKDPTQLITQVSKRGYATDPAYITSVMSIVKKHNLTQYDSNGGTKPMTLKQALSKLGVNLINRISQNRSQVPAHNANSHQYFAVHYLGVNGQNPDLYGGGYGGHFYVSKDGKCYQAAEVTDKLWHVGASSGFSYIHSYARNNNTIGVECGTYTASGRNNDDETWYFTEATQVTAAKLAAAVLTVYNLPMDHLLRHGDITTKNCPSPLKRDQGKGSNWTWNKFKSEVSKYMAQLGNESAPTVTILKLGSNGKQVKKLQESLLLLGFADCAYYNKNRNFVDSDFGQNTLKSLKYFQQAKGLQVDGIYGPKTAETLDKAVKEAKASKFNVTVDEFLNNAKTIAKENKENDFKYGNACCLPSVYPFEKITSCDRFVDQVLYKSGLKTVGNRGFTDLQDYLINLKAQKIYQKSQLQKGDIIYTIGHVFILGNKISNTTYQRYDAGSVERIQLTGPYASYKSQPFVEEINSFTYAYRLPFKTKEEKKEETSTTFLKLGDNGKLVKQMQKKLIKLGYYVGAAGADGDFGQNTLAALKYFQSNHGLDADGYCGSLTKQKLENIYNQIKNYDSPMNHDNLIKEKILITTDNLNLRKGSSVAHEIILQIPKGAKVKWHGYYTGSWYYVVYNGNIGYASSHYLK